LTDVLQRPFWNGEPAELGTWWTLRKRGATATCVTWSHSLGWELKLLIAGQLRQSRVCRTGDEMLETQEQWRAALMKKGWTS
jgi:hypothetical protein